MPCATPLRLLSPRHTVSFTAAFDDFHARFSMRIVVRGTGTVLGNG